MNSLVDDRFVYVAEQHEQYLKSGFCIFDHFLTDDGLAGCRQNIDRMFEQLHPDIAPDAIIATHLVERWVWELATHPAILDMIEKQIGPNITFWSSHLIAKPPNTGRPVPWHQDGVEWTNVNGNFGASIWIAFDDVNEASGTMAVIPGGHAKGALPRIQCADEHDVFKWDMDLSELPPNLDEIKVYYNLKAGQAAIHDVMMPHESGPNASNHWRRAMVFRYIAPDGELGGSTYYDYRTNEPMPRTFFLVRGEDVHGLGLPRDPFDHV